MFLKEGKVIGGIYCNILAIVFDTIIGKSLHDVEASLRKTWNQAAELGQGKIFPWQSDAVVVTGILTSWYALIIDAMLEWIKPTLQYVRNLQSNPSNWREVLMLNGEWIEVCSSFL